MDLTEAFAISNHEVVALTGAGGKTTTMYRLCAEALARGRRAVASGTARFSAPAPNLPVHMLVDEDEERLCAAVLTGLDPERAVVATTGHTDKERLTPISYEAAARIAAFDTLGLLALEADGSRMRPFKAPAGHEPAVPPCATLVIAIAGADVFGRPLTDEFVHRPEQVVALTGARLGQPITPDLVAAVLAHPAGGRKNVPAGARFAVMLNKVSLERIEAAREAARLMVAGGVGTVVLACMLEDAPLVEVVRA